jgi:hypothetical protein
MLLCVPVYVPNWLTLNKGIGRKTQLIAKLQIFTLSIPIDQHLLWSQEPNFFNKMFKRFSIDIKYNNCANSVVYVRYV